MKGSSGCTSQTKTLWFWYSADKLNDDECCLVPRKWQKHEIVVFIVPTLSSSAMYERLEIMQFAH